MKDRLEIFDEDAELVCGGYRDVFMGVWRTAVTVEGARRVAIPMERLAARHRRGLSLMFAMEEHCRMPDSPAREALARDVKRHEAFTRHMVMVFEGEGFRAAAFRSVLAGMQMLSRQKAPMKVVATVEQGAQWLAEQRIGELAALDLAAAFVQLRKGAR